MSSNQLRTAAAVGNPQAVHSQSQDDKKENEGFRVDKWKVGLFTVLGALVGFGFESLRQVGHEKVENHKLLTSYKPEAFDIDERSFVLMKKLERFGKSYPKKYVELVWILDALLFREKQLSYRNVPPLFSDVSQDKNIFSN